MVTHRHGLQNIDTKNSDMDTKGYLNSYLIDRTKGPGIRLKNKKHGNIMPLGV